MGIDDPISYGEHYWKGQLDAQEAFEEKLEESIAPFIPSLFTDPEIRAAVPFDILPKLEGMLELPFQGLSAVAGRFVSETSETVVGKLLEAALKNFGWASNRFFEDEHITAAQVTTLQRRKLITPEFASQRLSQWGFSDGEQLVQYASTADFPPIPDLVRWGRHFAGEEKMWTAIDAMFDVASTDRNVWEWLSEQQFTTDQITRLFRRQKITLEETDDLLRKLGWADGRSMNVIDMGYVLPNAMILLQGDLQAQAPQAEIITDLGQADIHPNFHQKYIDAVLTKPASIDLIQYHLRQDNELEGLADDLARIGVHPAYAGVYETLAYPIPPTADLITMAVREAFSPAVAERFGQYEDFPPDFAIYARQKGLTEEWAKRYWAAHWNLPSPQQGFAMLHRGVIDDSELKMLLRAQDVMPFWRDRLIEIAYKPLSRVDVRRMYKEGVLDESAVFSAYLDQGYSEDNSESLTEFTIKQTLSSIAKFTSTHVMGAFTSGIIQRPEASSLLAELGISSADRGIILDWNEHKRDWDYTEDRIAAIGNLFRRNEYNEADAQRELNKLNLPSDQVTVLMDRWWHEEKEKSRPTWTKAETLKFIKTEAITQERGIAELKRIGYDDEHIDVYLSTIK